MANLDDILIIFFISAIISFIIAFVYKSWKVTKKDYKQEDYARDKGSGVSIDL